MDVHFLRNARRAVRAAGPRSTSAFGGDGHPGAQHLRRRRRGARGVGQGARPAGRLPRRGPGLHPPAGRGGRRGRRIPLEERRGMYFVGNFRHLPNREAVEHLCNDVLPLLDPDLLARHPLTVLGNWLDRVELDVVRTHAGRASSSGWVPSVQPYADRARLGGRAPAARRRREAQGHPVDDGRHAGGHHAGRRRGPRPRAGRARPHRRPTPPTWPPGSPGSSPTTTCGTASPMPGPSTSPSATASTSSSAASRRSSRR